MGDKQITVGILLFVATVVFFTAKYFRAPKQGVLRWWGWAGLLTILLGEFFLFRHVPWVATFFTPLMWTGYVLLVDAMVWTLRGESSLGRAPWQFLSLAFWSVPLWLVFEAYNLRLENWTYVGLPDNTIEQGIGCLWSFATVWPAIFETADFVQALGLFRERRKPRTAFAKRTLLSLFVLGLLFVTFPLLVPTQVGRYLFGAVWVGFVLLLDPLNYWWKGQSLLRNHEMGETAIFWSFLVAGLVCGIFWEFWNYWASTRWVYVFPIWQEWKVFEMPLLGYLGFPPFALECFAMYEFLRTVKNQLLRLRSGTVGYDQSPLRDGAIE